MVNGRGVDDRGHGTKRIGGRRLGQQGAMEKMVHTRETVAAVTDPFSIYNIL